MFIQTEQTPNPATIKFLPGQDVLGERTANFPTAESASHSPLAQHIFGVDGVAAVFLGADFITVTTDGSDWQDLKPAVLGAIMEHLTAGLPILSESEGAQSSSEGHHSSGDGEDGEIVTQIKELLDTRVRPAVAQDGGDIVFHGFEDGIVSLHMQGACAGCPSSTATLKYGIENLLKHFIPEVTEVRQI